MAPTESEIQFWKTLPAQQQPDWDDNPLTQKMCEQLSALPPLVDPADVQGFRSLLAEVAAGRFEVMQAGDCAEHPAECSPDHISRKTALLDVLSGAVRTRSARPVIRVGRIAGQFGKPRSRPTEVVNNRVLPSYRGHLVNSPEPFPQYRQPDPERLLSCYWAASAAMDSLGRGLPDRGTRPENTVWTSHDALVLDYELPLLRRDDAGRLVLTSTHWPWIGERTRQLDGAHVALMAEVANPVACKISASISTDELLALCERLDPQRVPGRLTLIARMGVHAAAEALLPLVEAVRGAGHPVIWMCDPMHGNTVSTAAGIKTRTVAAIIGEIGIFRTAVATGGGVIGGLHLETTPSDVTECVADNTQLDDAEAHERYATLCDPRLNPMQAFQVALAWTSDAVTHGVVPSPS